MNAHLECECSIGGSSKLLVSKDLLASWDSSKYFLTRKVLAKFRLISEVMEAPDS